jgi:pimeloyl-ACP methyl ester carboxylesterase
MGRYPSGIRESTHGIAAASFSAGRITSGTCRRLRVRETPNMGHDQTTTAADGTTIAWSSRGSGSPVLLVHGITESAATFDPITDRLAADHEVITMDLRGHGESGNASTYDLGAMAGDVIVVAQASGTSSPHLVGHSLGGVVVSAAGAAFPVGSVTDVDQSLQLASFKEMLMPAEPMLRDPDQYHVVLGAMFAAMMGDKLSADEIARVNALRRPQHDVVFGVWELILTEPLDVIEATVDAALAAYAGQVVPYLALFGADPGPDYDSWLSSKIAGARTETWAEHGHYPHLVDPDRFVNTITTFWTGQ